MTELKGGTTTIKVVAIIEWIKSISKHPMVKGIVSIGRSGAVVLKMDKLFDLKSGEIVDKTCELAREGKLKFANSDEDLLDKVKEGISGDLWGAIEDHNPKTGTAAIALLIQAVVHRLHVVMAAITTAVSNDEAVAWNTGLTKGVIRLLAALIMTGVRYTLL